MHTNNENHSRNEPRHSIAVVSRRTGLSQLVLRSWERRYNAVIPGRTPTGRRKYSDLDLEKLILLELLTSDSHRIGDIAGQSIDTLKELASALPAESLSSAKGQNFSLIPKSVLLDEALDAVANLDTRRLELVLDRALVDLSKPQLRNELLVPMLEEIGNRWREGKLRVAHEHMASNIVMAFLSSMNSRYRVSPGAPVVAVATPAGQMHELGALLASSLAYEFGWEVLYLGSNLPAEDIAVAAKSRGAQAVLLSLVFPHADARTKTELRELRQLIGPKLQLIVGGQAADSYRGTLAEIDARIVSNSAELERALSL